MTTVRPAAYGRAFWLFASMLVITLVMWAAVGIASERVRLATVAPDIQGTLEGASALARLFGALVLFLTPSDHTGRRLRWVAAGLVILGLGGFAFGYLPSGQVTELGLNTLMYASISVWTAAGACFVAGLVPDRVPRLAWIVPVLSAMVVVGIAFLSLDDATHLPALAHQTDFTSAVARGAVPMPGLTAWHWMLSLVALSLAIAAAIGAAIHLGPDRGGAWIVIAMTVLAGSQVHNLLWPSAFGPILTSANLLRFVFAIVIVVGGVFELRRIAAERTSLLSAEQEYSRRLVDLARVKADFTAMAAHELGAPVAAIGGWADVLATGELSTEQQTRAIATIRAEIKALNSLVADVRAVINAERDDFSVRPIPVPLEELVVDAVAFARVLPGDHWISWSYDLSGEVLADPIRIGQVLRNLLANAAKYSAPDSPIEIRVVHHEKTVHVDIVDSGYGIHPDDLSRVFEKFGRGRDADGRRVHGVGLGLYLSHRIILAHGGELTVSSTPGAGSVFGFDLERVS